MSPAPASASGAASGLASVPAAEPVVDSPAATSAAGGCPEVAVIAARGSDQNIDLEPQRYAPDTRWESNGFESVNIAAGLHLAQQRHRMATGESLFANVPVIALDDSVYAAAANLPVLAERGSDPSSAELASSMVEMFAQTPPHEIAYNSLRDAVTSVTTAIEKSPDYIAGIEQEMGCEPDYVLVGYSQGSFVLGNLEQHWYEQGRLRGVLYLGNPLLDPDDPTTVGGQQKAQGMLSAMPASLGGQMAPVKRINYCLDGDFVCDFTVESAVAGLRDEAGVHGDYFLTQTDRESQEYIADQLASWISPASE